MSHIESFAAYAGEFEKVFLTGNWASLERFFTEDCVYEIGLRSFGKQRCENRDATLQWFAYVTENFDKRFNKRELSLLEGPIVAGNCITIRGLATYSADGLPDLVLELEEIMTFGEGRIVRLEDRYTESMQAVVEEYLAAYGPALKIQLA